MLLQLTRNAKIKNSVATLLVRTMIAGTLGNGLRVDDAKYATVSFVPKQ